MTEIQLDEVAQVGVRIWAVVRPNSHRANSSNVLRQGQEMDMGKGALSTSKEFALVKDILAIEDVRESVAVCIPK